MEKPESEMTVQELRARALQLIDKANKTPLGAVKEWAAGNQEAKRLLELAMEREAQARATE